MSPENRTRSALGPLPQRRAWLTGGAIASLALMLSGIASPVLAAGQPAKAAVGVSAASETVDECTYDPDGVSQQVVTRDGDDGDDDGDRRGCRPTGPCNDIDAYYPLFLDPQHQVTGVLFDPDKAGRLPVEASVGIRTVPGGTYDWDLISDNPGFPLDACSISVSSVGNGRFVDDTSVQVLTKAGVVWETTCTQVFADPDAVPPVTASITCNAPWTRVTPQP